MQYNTAIFIKKQKRMNINQLEKKLSESLEYLNSCTDDSEANTVVYQCISLCDNILELDSNHVTALISRMKLNLHPTINNTSDYIADAEKLAKNPVFSPDFRMHGYESLIYAYNDLLGMTEQAIKIAEDQLIDVQGLFSAQFQKHGAEAHVLNTLGNLYFNQDNTKQALVFWSKSFDKDPFIFERNQMGVHHLLAENWSEASRFLTKYYQYCYNYEDDGFRVALGKKLEEFLKAGKLDNEPTLIALYYHIVRNEEASFGIKSTSGFIENYFQDLLAWGEKFPQSSLLWVAIGNTCFFIDNYVKAIEAYSKVLTGDAPFTILVLDRLHTACKETDTDFFAIPMPKGEFPNELYNVATKYLQFYNAGEKA